MNKNVLPIRFQSPYLIWFLGAFFFFIDYVIRVSPSILTPTLITYFQTNAFTIGKFSAFFYFAYIAMQVPVGILVDKFGPKWLLLISSLICGLGTFIFAHMSTIQMGFLSRFLMGFGASFAFVGTLKLISIWFIPQRFAFLAGLTQAFGMLGAMIGQGPMALVYQALGWRSSMLGLGVLFVILALLMFFFILDKDNPILEKHLDSNQTLKILPSLKLVLTNKQHWLNCLFIGMLYGPTTCFGEQWGASFLSLNQGISIEAAGQQTGILFIGLAIGCPIIGWVSDRLQRRLLVMRVSVCVCLLLLTLIIYGKLLGASFILNPVVCTSMLFIYGFFNSGIVCSYALASEISPLNINGIALGVTNMASVLIGAAMIPVVGFILDKASHEMSSSGIPIYDLSSYQWAFIALPVVFIIAFGITFLQKETYCQRVAD